MMGARDKPSSVRRPSRDEPDLCSSSKGVRDKPEASGRPFSAGGQADRFVTEWGYVPDEAEQAQPREQNHN
jgi:hypothetical protein